MDNPKDLRYTNDHEWVRPAGQTWRVGITHFAQKQLGDVVFVENAKPGTKLSQGESFGTVESVKAVSELFSPIDGEVVAVNEQLADEPELLNTDPYGEGWVVEIKPSSTAQKDELMSADAYDKFIAEEQRE